MKPMPSRRVNVRGIVFQDGKILAQQLTPDHHGNPRFYWCTPGGGLEANESLLDGLKREFVEETGVVPQIGRLLYIQQFNDGEMEQLELFYHIVNPQDFNNIDITKTSNGAIETTNIEFVDASQTQLLPKFLRTEDIASHIASSQPVKLFSSL
jgi:ADP-ribose pyrophosphatase YjhB (NUDIX family)